MLVLMPFGRVLGRHAVSRPYHIFTRHASSSTLLRASSTQANSPSTSDSSHEHSSNRLFQFPSRAYATEASAKPVGRSKGHTGRTATGRSTTKAKATTTKKNPAKKAPARPRAKPKPKAKPKSRPKAKPKPKVDGRKRKVLSKTALNQARLARDRDLRAKALLTEPKKPAASAWVVYSAQACKNATTFDPQRLKDISRQFKNLSPEEHEKLNHTANQNLKNYENDYKKWLSSHSPTEIKEANTARQALNREKKAKAGNTKVHLIPMLKDDRLVKHPTSTWSYFLKERWASGDFKHMKLAESSRLISREYKALSASEKERYEEQAKGDHNRYVEELKTVYGKDFIPSKKSATT